MATLTISIPDSLKSFIQKQMKTKGFGNVSEYFRDLLRKAQMHEEENQLDLLLREGLSSGKGREATKEFWDELKSKIDQRLAQGHPAKNEMVSDRVARLTTNFVDRYREALKRLA